MQPSSPAAPLRVLLINKTMIPWETGLWTPDTTGAFALGAFCLKEAVRREPDLAQRVDVQVRSYPSDARTSLVVREVMEARPDIVGFTCQPWNHQEHIRISRILRQLAPEMTVVHGGPMVIDLPAYLERHGRGVVHVAVEGEAEEAFVELLRHWLDGSPALPDIRGIAFFDGDGRPHATPDRDNPDVSALPPVMTPDNLAQMGSDILYETSRGCPFDCKFCNWGSQKMKLRTRSREVIEADLRAILSSPGLRSLWIVDSGLDISREHILFLAGVIKKYRRNDVRVSGYFFLHQKDLSHIAQLKGAFDTLQVGLQTANDNALTVIGRKGLSVHRFDRIFDAVIPHFPDLRVDLIYGLPDLGYEALRESFRFLMTKGVRQFNVFRLVAIPGTEMAEKADVFGLISDGAPSYEVYGSNGIPPAEMFQMQQFKVNVDTLRAVFARGVYNELFAEGIDLVDFAEKLHTFIPNFNRRIRFELEGDLPPGSDLVEAFLEAAEKWSPGDPRRVARLKELLTNVYRRGSGEPEVPPELLASVPPPAPPTHPPSIALRRFTRSMMAAMGPFARRWSQNELRSMWENFLRQSRHARKLGAYVHIPFCERICTFCDCSTGKLDDRAKLDRYLDSLETEMDGLADLFRGRTFERLYVGGGSPNILNPDQLDRMLGMVLSRHRMADDAVRCVEMDPRLTTPEKIRIARSHGVNRISFGVQSLSEKVLFNVNRLGQEHDDVARCVNDVLEAGVPEVNLDLIFSLADQTPESFVEEAMRCLQMQVTTLCIQLLVDSDFAKPYRDEQHRLRVAEQFHEVKAGLRRKLEGSGLPYRLHERPDTLVLVRDGMWRDWTGHLDFYSSFDRNTHSSVGYGRYAQSWMRGVVHYQSQNVAAGFDPAANVYSGRLLTPELEVVALLTADLEYHRSVDTRSAIALEGQEAFRRVEPLLHALQKTGHLQREGHLLRDVGLTPEAITWLVESARGDTTEAPKEEEAPKPEELGVVRMSDDAGAWTIRFERVHPERRYFATVGGLGIYYQADPGVTLDGKRVATTLKSVVDQVELYLRAGTTPEEVPRQIAEFLRTRLVEIGVSSAQAERVGVGRHRRSAVAPG